MKKENEKIRGVVAEDQESITRIYNHYISNTIATFQEEELTPKEMEERIQETLNAGLPWLVAERNGKVAGYAYATKWKERSSYRFSVESTVYLDLDQKGQGLGSMLYKELFRLLNKKGVHTVIGGISLPNEASIALHEKFEMEKVAHFKEVGYKFGRWIDVGYWQRIF